MTERLDSRRGPGGRRRAFFVLGGALAAFCALLWIAAACAPPEPTPGPAAEARDDERREAARALTRVERLQQQEEHAAAARLADSLYRAWRTDPALASSADRALWLRGRSLEARGELGRAAGVYERLLDRGPEDELRTDATRRLAALLLSTGRSEGAVELLLDHPAAIGPEELGLLREAVPPASHDQLDRWASDFGPEHPGGAVVHAERVGRLAAAGRMAEAERAARRLLEANPPEEEARLARTVLAGEPAVVRVGAVLPLTGRFASVGELLREGYELAFQERGARLGRPRVMLEVRDDGSDPERAVELVAELERAGVVAILGPVRSESFAGAARARRNPRLPLVSPTATEVLARLPHAYSLWSRQRRDGDVARDLAAWAVGRLGLRRAAILYPVGDQERAVAEAFARAVREAGGEVSRVVSYPPDATTFEAQIGEVAAVEPEVVFVATESVPTVLQIAPQLSYYGVTAAVVAGGATWAEPAAVRRLEPTAINVRIVGTFVDRLAEGTSWKRFEAAYEGTYRKPLRDNMLPALAYDAAGLVLDAVEGARFPLPAAVAERLASLPERDGATGRLRPDPATSTVTRRTLLRMLQDRALVPAEPVTVLERLEEARLVAEQAERDSVWVRP